MAKRLRSKMSDTTKYIIGFLLSIVLTFGSYLLVVNKIMDGTSLLLWLGILALTQVIVQLFFFLHLGEGSDRRLKAAAFLSMLIVLIIIVGGSLWIMHHLDYNMMNMPAEQVQERMNKEAGF